MSETTEQTEEMKMRTINGLSRFTVETQGKKILFIEGADPGGGTDSLYMHYKMTPSEKLNEVRDVVIFVRDGQMRHAQLIENAVYDGRLSAKMAERLTPTGGGKVTRRGDHRPSQTYGSPNFQDEDLVMEVFQKIGVVRRR